MEWVCVVRVEGRASGYLPVVVRLVLTRGSYLEWLLEVHFVVGVASAGSFAYQ